MFHSWLRWSPGRVALGLTVLAVLGAVPAMAQDLAAPPTWQQQFGTSMDELALAVTSARGDVYTVGYTSGQLGVEPAAGGQDVFVAKHDAAGGPRWVRQLGTSGNDRALAVASDVAGNVYVAGYTWGSFAPYVNAGGADIFLAMYDAEGVRQWVRQLGTGSDDFATGIAVTRREGQDGLFISGYSLGRFDGTSSPGNYDVVVAKFDTGGNPYWLRQFGTGRSDVALGVAVSGDEDVYVAGYTSGSLDGVTSPGTTVDLFAAKLDVLGETRWVHQLGSTSDEYATGIAVAADGSVYVSGYTFGGLDGNTRVGAYDAVLLKFDASGARLWTRQLGTTTTDYGQAVAVGADGLVHLAGYTSGSLDGNVSSGGSDLFLATYTADGQRSSTLQVGTASSDRGLGVATSEDGGVYLVGYTWGSLPGASSSGGYDAVLIRF